MKSKLLRLIALGAVVASMSATASLHIIPSSDPGNVKVGDTLTFTVSIDPIAPPSGQTWGDLNLVGFRILGPPSDGNFNGTCADLSGLPADVTFHCLALSSGAGWAWEPVSANTSSVSGDLFSFEGLFSEVGAFSVFLDSAFANFNFDAGGGTSENIGFTFTRTSPILIHVTAAAAVPEPATLALLGVGLAGLGFSRRRKLN